MAWPERTPRRWIFVGGMRFLLGRFTANFATWESNLDALSREIGIAISGHVPNIEDNLWPFSEMNTRMIANG